jgi:hypothetical protein
MIPTIAKPLDENNLAKEISIYENDQKIDEIDCEKRKKDDQQEKKTDIFNEFFTTTSINGIPNLYKAESWPLRLFWLILILAAVGGCIYCKRVFLIKSLIHSLL